jgi:hypothetical protein
VDPSKHIVIVIKNFYSAFSMTKLSNAHSLLYALLGSYAKGQIISLKPLVSIFKEISRK